MPESTNEKNQITPIGRAYTGFPALFGVICLIFYLSRSFIGWQTQVKYHRMRRQNKWADGY